VNDVFSNAGSLGFNRFHLIGPDWGAIIGWGMVDSSSNRVLSWTPCQSIM